MELETRLRRLERRCRLYHALFILAGVLLAALAGLGAAAPTPDVVRAHRFELVDDQGRVMVRLRVWPPGGLVEVRNAWDETTTWIGQNAGGHGVITISSRDGGGVIGAGSDDDGNGFINVLDRAGEGRTILPTR